MEELINKIIQLKYTNNITYELKIRHIKKIMHKLIYLLCIFEKYLNDNNDMLKNFYINDEIKEIINKNNKSILSILNKSDVELDNKSSDIIISFLNNLNALLSISSNDDIFIKLK